MVDLRPMPARRDSGHDPMNTFYIEISTGLVLLTKDQVWPDGDGPENPTKEDVEDLIKGSLERGIEGLCKYPWELFELAQKWNLHDGANLFVSDGLREVTDG